MRGTILHDFNCTQSTHSNNNFVRSRSCLLALAALFIMTVFPLTGWAQSGESFPDDGGIPEQPQDDRPELGLNETINDHIFVFPKDLSTICVEKNGEWKKIKSFSHKKAFGKKCRYSENDQGDAEGCWHRFQKMAEDTEQNTNCSGTGLQLANNESIDAIILDDISEWHHVKCKHGKGKIKALSLMLSKNNMMDKTVCLVSGNAKACSDCADIE